MERKEDEWEAKVGNMRRNGTRKEGMQERGRQYFVESKESIKDNSNY